jgi:HK97 family phage major capsid protein
MNENELRGIIAEEMARARPATTPDELRDAIRTEIREVTQTVSTAQVPDMTRTATVPVRDSLGSAKFMSDIFDMAENRQPRFFTKDQLKAAYNERTGMYSTTTAGGYLVPTEQILEPINLVSADYPLISRCRRIPMETDTITIPTVATGITTYWVPEVTNTSSMASQATGQKQESQYVFGQVTLTRYVVAAYMLVTNKLLRTSLGAMQRFLETDVPNRLWDACDDAILTGTATAASDPITGLDTAVTTNVIPWDAAAPFDSVIKTIYAPAKQLPGIAMTDTIVTSPAGYEKLLTVKDGNGQYVLGPPTNNGFQGSFWGIPVIVDSNIPSTYGDGDDTRLYAGDFGRHANIGFANAMDVQVNPYLYSQNNLVLFRFEMPFGFVASSQTAFAYTTISL